MHRIAGRSLRRCCVSLAERDVGRLLAHSQYAHELCQVGFQPIQRRGIQPGQGLRQDAVERPRCTLQDLVPGGQHGELHGAPVRAIAPHGDQAPFGQHPDQIAGRGLVDIHGTRQVVDPDTIARLDDAQGPQLGASQASLPFDLLKMGLDGIEYLPELAQHPRRCEVIFQRVTATTLGRIRGTIGVERLRRRGSFCHLTIIEDKGTGPVDRSPHD